MSEQHVSENKSMELDIFPKDEIDLVDILRKIIAIRKTLYKAAGIGMVVGVIIALSIPKYYTVKVTLSPEMGGAKGNSGLAGLAASFLGSGATAGDASDALNASFSSDIVSSTPFLLELLDITVSPSNGSKNISLASYLDEQTSPWWNYVIGLPGVLINSIKSLFVDSNKIDIVNKMKQGTIELTKDENDRINTLKRNITALVDQKTAITNISVTLQDPKVTAVVADSVVCKLQEYIINYRTSKAKEDCTYLERLCKERQQEYYMAQKKYAVYIDTHDDIILQSVRAEQERLQNDMNLAYQVYSQVSNQLQVARAKVQEEKPVFAVLEPAVVPQQSSGMGMKIYILLFMFLAIVGTISWIFIVEDLWNRLKEVR